MDCKIFSEVIKETRFSKVGDNKINEVKLNIDNKEIDVHLIDDGTLDTVIKVNGKEARFDAEYASQYRDKSGNLTEEGLIALAKEVIEDEVVESKLEEKKTTNMRFSVDLEVVVDDVPTKREIEELLADKYGSARISDFKLVESKLEESAIVLEFKVGDKVKTVRPIGISNSDKEIPQGSVGVVKSIEGGNVIVDFDEFKGIATNKIQLGLVESKVNEDASKDKRKFDIKQNISFEVFPAIQSAMKKSKEQYPDMTEEEFYDVVVPASKEAVLSLGLQFKDNPASVPEPVQPQKLEAKNG